MRIRCEVVDFPSSVKVGDEELVWLVSGCRRKSIGEHEYVLERQKTFMVTSFRIAKTNE